MALPKMIGVWLESLVLFTVVLGIYPSFILGGLYYSVSSLYIVQIIIYNDLINIFYNFIVSVLASSTHLPTNIYI